LVWEPVQTHGKAGYRCLVCNDMHIRDIRRLLAHERTQDHINALKYRQETQMDTPPNSFNPSGVPLLPDFVADGTRSLLESLSAPAGYSTTNAYQDPSPRSPSPRLIDWGLSESTELESSLDSQAVAMLAHKLLEYLDADPVSDDDQEERSDGEDDRDKIQEPIVAGECDAFVDDGNENAHGRKRARTQDPVEHSRQWYPWPDRITCTLDVLMHLPRSVFSHRQLDLFTWLLKVNEVDDVPSVKMMQEVNVMLQSICGIDSIPYDGALGHKYYVNNLAQIIAQEMSNPKVRPHLQFYPEDSGKVLEEASQGKRWLDEIPSEKTTPMARIGKQDYFIYETAMLRNGTVCMPFRWFMRGGIVFAKCWEMTVVDSDTGRYWRVLKHESEVSQSELMKNLPDLQICMINQILLESEVRLPKLVLRGHAIQQEKNPRGLGRSPDKLCTSR
ncbi:hypothetical protein R3P38DRAFT_2588312, partial [Favolaschia claudopus]